VGGGYRINDFNLIEQAVAESVIPYFKNFLMEKIKILQVFKHYEDKKNNLISVIENLKTNKSYISARINNYLHENNKKITEIGNLEIKDISSDIITDAILINRLPKALEEYFTLEENFLSQIGLSIDDLDYIQDILDNQDILIISKKAEDYRRTTDKTFFNLDVKDIENMSLSVIIYALSEYVENKSSNDIITIKKPTAQDFKRQIMNSIKK